MKSVLIVHAFLPDYRIPFFEKLNETLGRANIRLRVAYGQPPGNDDAAIPHDLPFGVRTRNFWLLRGRLLVQPLLRAIMQADLVIVEQANKHLVNYFLVLLSLLGFPGV